MFGRDEEATAFFAKSVARVEINYRIEIIERRMILSMIVSRAIGEVQSLKVKSVQICTDCSPNLSRRPVNTDRASILKYLIVESAVHT